LTGEKVFLAIGAFTGFDFGGGTVAGGAGGATLRENESISVFGANTEGLFSIGGAWVKPTEVGLGGSGFRNSGGGGKDETGGVTVDETGGGAGKDESVLVVELTISFGSYFVCT